MFIRVGGEVNAARRPNIPRAARALQHLTVTGSRDAVIPGIILSAQVLGRRVWLLTSREAVSIAW
ncbi:hypothetical protein AC579_7823 [Pseudocercospora musae]|uniref:Uncharacterized protein n=1 Tax=Pseudocercospora musae TaxID=113226 RepID=A0A139I421_9PEZI|nr:hypothetical protein AC579_7823 [Pseudocercospora musae]